MIRLVLLVLLALSEPVSDGRVEELALSEFAGGERAEGLALSGPALRGRVEGIAAPPDNSGPTAAESPLVGFTTVSSPGAEGRARAGVLDARTGRVLWGVSFAGGVNDACPSVHGDLLAVVINSRSEGYACHVFSFATGRPRFRTDGAAVVDLSNAGRRLLGFPGRDRMAALDPATGLEAWTAPVTRHGVLTILPGRDFFVVEGPRHLTAYSLENGRQAWEREKAPEDRLRLSGGRLWSLKPLEPRLVEVDPLTGGEKTALDLSGPLVAIVPQRDFVDLVLQREVRRLRGRDLALEWATPLPAEAASGHGDARSVVLGGGGDGDRTFLLDAGTGRLLSDHSVERFTRRDASLAHPRYFIQASRAHDGTTILWVLDRRDGRIAWKDVVEDYEEGGSRDTLLLQREGRLLLVDLATRTERWSRPLDGPWRVSARRGELVLVGTARSIAGLESGTGREAWKIDLAPAASEVRFAPGP